MNIQSDVNTTQRIKLTANFKIRHPNSATANGTSSIARWFDITEDETIVDHSFVHSIHDRVGGSDVSTWTISNAKFTYDDGTIINAQLRDRKNVREWANHGANGMQDGHSVKYTFDLAYTKEFVEIIDESDNSHSISKFGDVRHLSDDKSLFGESSLYFDGNGDYLQIEDNSLRNLHNGANDFTIESWVNIQSWVRDSSGQQRSHILGTV